MSGTLECVMSALPEALSNVLGIEKNKVADLIISGKIKASPTPDPRLGDYGIAIHIVLKDTERRRWEEIGSAIAEKLYILTKERCWIERVDFVNGYVNITVDYSRMLLQLVEEFATKKIFSELANTGGGSRVIVEHTSANPVHPLHIGSGRNSVLGDTYARLLRKLGFSVQTRFYVNDLGRQMATLVYGVTLAKSSGIDEQRSLKVDHWYGIIYALTNVLIDLSRLRSELRKRIDRLLEQARKVCEEFTNEGSASGISVDIGFALCEIAWKSNLKFELLKRINDLYKALERLSITEGKPAVREVINTLRELLELSKEYKRLLAVERALSTHHPALYKTLRSSITDHIIAEESIKKLMQLAESGNREALESFRKVAENVIEGFKQTLKSIGVEFDGFDYESASGILGRAHEIVKDLLKTKYAKLVEGGAVEVDLNAAAGDHEYVKKLFYPDQAGRFVVQRSDGTTLYVTRDIAYTIYKFKDLGAERVYNVIAIEQAREQKQLKAVLYILGYLREAENLNHFAYEMVHLKGLRMSGRRGIYYTIDEMLTDSKLNILRKLLEKEGSSSMVELIDVAEKLAVANVRALLLSVDPSKVLVFDPKRIGEAEYGTIIEYAFVRAQGVIRNLWGIEFLDDPNALYVRLANIKQDLSRVDLFPEEKKLVEMVARFKEVLLESYREMKPNKLLEYAVNLALEFNKFYEKHSVIGERDVPRKNARIAITVLVLIVLSELMDIMGLPKLRKM